jgi:hypothetical protein
MSRWYGMLGIEREREKEKNDQQVFKRFTHSASKKGKGCERRNERV